MGETFPYPPSLMGETLPCPPSLMGETLPRPPSLMGETPPFHAGEGIEALPVAPVSWKRQPWPYGKHVALLPPRDTPGTLI